MVSRSLCCTHRVALTSQRQLHMRTGLDSAQAYSSGVFGVVEDTRFLVVSNRSARAKTIKSFKHGSHFCSVPSGRNAAQPSGHTAVRHETAKWHSSTARRPRCTTCNAHDLRALEMTPPQKQRITSQVTIHANPESLNNGHMPSGCKV